MILDFLFFILLAGLAFRLRGIWGHQIGGAVFGILVGSGLMIIYPIPLASGIMMLFSMMISCLVSSFVGWYNHNGGSRFLIGYIVYGCIPNLILCIFMFPHEYIIWIELIFIGGLGMGVGFGCYSYLLIRVRESIKQKFYSQNSNEKEVVFEKLKSNKEISHVYHTKFNTWTYLMEVPSGALYGLTTILILHLNQENISPINLELGIFQYIVIFLIFGPLISLQFIDGYRRKNGVNPNSFNFNQVRWSSTEFIKRSIYTGIIGMSFGVFTLLIFNILTIKAIFLIFLWITIASARFSCENDSKMMQIDIVFDCVCGLIASVLILFF